MLTPSSLVRPHRSPPVPAHTRLGRAGAAPALSGAARPATDAPSPGPNARQLGDRPRGHDHPPQGQTVGVTRDRHPRSVAGRELAWTGFSISVSFSVIIPIVIATRRCALEGCDVPVVRHPSGGRPRLYCSDAHRAEARRRRLGATPAARVEDPLGAVHALLIDAVAQIQALPRSPSDDALLAEVKAQSTGEVLRAQQEAADALRRASAAETRLADERVSWERTLQERDASLAAQAHRVSELSKALDGARDALEAELLTHHQDLQSLQAALETHRAVHDAACQSWEAELGECRDALSQAGAEVAAAAAEARRSEAGAADAHARERAAAARAAAAERRAGDAERTAQDQAATLARLTRELAAVAAERDAARRERSSLVAEVRRRDLSARRARIAGGVPGRRRISPAASRGA